MFCFSVIQAVKAFIVHLLGEVVTKRMRMFNIL